MTPPAQQSGEGDVTASEPQVARAGILGRYELGAAARAALIFIGRKMLQGKNRVGHGAPV
jgi:hypothetical protein